ncbi:hypothetical protein TNCV_2259861 [Trichonephila clavipes]|nr:hypothetical protein TNCV_2259861 [Trichonephila clavipes]
MTLHSPTENSLAVLITRSWSPIHRSKTCEIRRSKRPLINRLWHELCDMLRRLVEPQLLDIMIVQFRNEKTETVPTDVFALLGPISVLLVKKSSIFWNYSRCWPQTFAAIMRVL